MSSPKDLSRFSIISKLWRTNSMHDDLWVRFAFNEHFHNSFNLTRDWSIFDIHELRGDVNTLIARFIRDGVRCAAFSAFVFYRHLRPDRLTFRM
jgi:hypothetical protein